MIASPLSTTFGGVCCKPRALRSRLNTITSFVNAVIITATYGASASPTTSVRIRAGDSVPSSIVGSLGLRQHARDAQAEQIAQCHELAMRDRNVVGKDGDHLVIEGFVEFEYETRGNVCQHTERNARSANAEAQRDRQRGGVDCAIRCRRPHRVGGWRRLQVAHDVDSRS